MVPVSELYQLAADEHIPVIPVSIPENGSMCVQTNHARYIGMDYAILEDDASERVHLAHELGHCETGSFYNIWAALDIRQKHENRADRWAIERMIPKDELDDAVSRGYTEPWALAERFGVTEEFVRKAMWFYRHGNLAVEF